jgi:A/G-specific adenine glycosylase
MTEVPGGSWTQTTQPTAPAPPLPAQWDDAGRIEHVFTHFRLVLTVLTARLPASAPAPDGHWWSTADRLAGEALPTVMRKAVEQVLPGATKRRRSGA